MKKSTIECGSLKNGCFASLQLGKRMVIEIFSGTLTHPKPSSDKSFDNRYEEKIPCVSVNVFKAYAVHIRVRPQML